MRPCITYLESVFMVRGTQVGVFSRAFTTAAISPT